MKSGGKNFLHANYSITIIKKVAIYRSGSIILAEHLKNREWHFLNSSTNIIHKK